MFDKVLEASQPKNMSYYEYVQIFNDEHTDLRYTPEGAIAKFQGIWYSVNGSAGNIVDVRYPLNEKELAAYKVVNDSPVWVPDYLE